MNKTIKGCESSIHFGLFTKAKSEVPTFEILCSRFGLRLQRSSTNVKSCEIFNKYEEYPKKCLKTMNLFSQPQLPGKKETE